MNSKKIKLFVCLSAVTSLLFSQELPPYEPLKKQFTPLELACYIADKVIKNSQFEYQYEIQQPYEDIESVNFGHTFGTAKPSIAYALSTFNSEASQDVTFDVGRTGSLKIWVNDALVFSGGGNKDLPVRFRERSYILDENFTVRLEKGENKVLIKSAFSGRGEWKVFLQTNNLTRYAKKGYKILPSVKKYAPTVDFTHWLVLGCFDGLTNSMDKPLEPEKEIVFHKIYSDQGKTFTWDLPRIHIITDHKYSNHAWAYHMGGVMWSLQRLTQETKDTKYNDYASHYLEFTFNSIPIVEYQTRELNAVRSMNWGMMERPMLDYTTAPSLPYMTRLVYEKDFPARKDYVTQAEKMMNYVINEQFRLPEGVFARQYTGAPTVWADDMFMGIPYLLYSAAYTGDKALQKRLYDDAANQIIRFNKILYKEDALLYMQAIQIDKPDEKIPFWSRGNGWALWGTTETLGQLPGNHPQYKTILRIYRKHIEGIARVQDDGGYWHNILDLPESAREASGNAIFVLCIARGINNGWLDKKKYGPVLEKGWTALKSFIDNDGNFYGTKGGTNFSPDVEDYARTSFSTNNNHGIFPLIFSCIEMEKYYQDGPAGSE